MTFASFLSQPGPGGRSFYAHTLMCGWIAASWGLFFILFIATNPGVCGEQRAGSLRGERPDPTEGFTSAMARHRLSPNPIPRFAISAIRFLVWLLIIKQHGMLSPLLFAAERAPVQDHHRLHRGAPMEISEVCSDPRCADMQPSACWAITLFPHVTEASKVCGMVSASYAALWAFPPPSHFCTTLSPPRGAGIVHLPCLLCLAPLFLHHHQMKSVL